jgi:hypothetical protein
VQRRFSQFSRLLIEIDLVEVNIIPAGSVDSWREV